MTKEQVYAIKENRYKTLNEREKNIKCPGVLKRLRRELRNLKSE